MIERDGNKLSLSLNAKRFSGKEAVGVDTSPAACTPALSLSLVLDLERKQTERKSLLIGDKQRCSRPRRQNDLISATKKLRSPNGVELMYALLFYFGL